MKTLKKLIVVSVVLMASLCSWSQTLLTNTTLSAALSTGTNNKVVVVASATGITAPLNGAIQTVLVVDSEAMEVLAVSGTTITVRRGYFSSPVMPHKSGALVFAGNPNVSGSQSNPGWLINWSWDPQGSCTRSNVQVLPIINVRTGNKTDSVGGVWVNGQEQNLANAFFRILAPNSGGTAYTSLNTNGTTLSASTMYCTEIDLQSNKYVTGIAVMNGTTVGTDKHLVALYDSAGNLIVNSAVAGALSSGASTYQTYAFTTPYFAVGPAQYFGCVQTNGTTDTIRMIVTGTQDTYLTKGVTGQTFGTLAAFTAPTTFTTAVGPYLELY